MLKEKITETKYLLTFDSKDEADKFFRMATPSSSLKASDVMRILDITRPTLCHYVKRGLIEVEYNYTGKQYRYNAQSVYRLKESR